MFPPEHSRIISTTVFFYFTLHIFTTRGKNIFHAMKNIFYAKGVKRHSQSCKNIFIFPG